MNRRVFLAVLIFCVGIQAVACEDYIFTSIDNLIHIFEAFNDITNKVVKYSEVHEEDNPQFEKFLYNYHQVNKIKASEQRKFLSNPINAYILVRMLTRDLKYKIPKISLYKDSDDGKEILEILYEDVQTHFQEGKRLSESDIDGALTAINRLINAYRFKIDDVIIGKFNENSRSLFPLDAFDCLSLAGSALMGDEFHLAYAWVNKSLELLERDPSYPYASKKDAYKLMANLSEKQNNTFMAHEYRKRITLEYPDDVQAAEDLKAFVESLAEKNLTIEDGQDRPLMTERNVEGVPIEKLQYENLCREKKGSLLPVKPLDCRYVNDHPFLVIGPVKEEKIYDDPPMWIYYDTLTEKQADYLKKIGLPKLSRAKVGGGSLSNIRITQTYFFEREKLTDRTLRYLDYFVSAITKLSLQEAESWQIANYGIGGQYEPHTDHFVRGNLNVNGKGDRFATWLNYIEAPELGGDTVFVNLRIKTKAISRSSVLWYNLGKNLTGDPRALHAACPVVLGSKWVNNKWIRQNDQMFTKPCPLTLD